jgi:hypothetical protein
MAEEEADLALVSEDLWLVAGILAFNKRRRGARGVEQGIVQVEMRILKGVVAVCRIVVYASRDSNRGMRSSSGGAVVEDGASS